MLFDYREVDDDEDQIRGHEGAQRRRRAVRPDPVDEGYLRGQVALRTRLSGRGRPPDARPLRPGRLADQALRLAGRGEALATPRRAHRRDPRLARLWQG